MLCPMTTSSADPLFIKATLTDEKLMKIDTIRLSEKAKNQLIAIKRKTGIAHWNVLCRWSFCLSLLESTKPPHENIPSDSSVEMSWRVFGGPHADVYLALLRQRAHFDKVELSDKNVLEYFRLHLHRGISYLANQSEIANVASLVRLVAK